MGVAGDGGSSAGELVRLEDLAQSYVGRSRSENTVKAYRADWSHFTAWCSAHDRGSLPASPQTVALYITALAQDHKPATIRRRLSTITVAHRLAGHDTPVADTAVRLVWAGIRRTHGTAPDGAAALVTSELARLIDALPDDASGIRDRALLLVGFAAALRRSDLVGLDTGDAVEVGEGLVINLRRSKTDPDGQGRRIGVPYGSHPTTCPVRALRAWRELLGVEGGPLFRPVSRHGHIGDGRLSDRAVPLIIKRAAARAGLDPARYSGHSLRAGFVTAAAAAGVPERDIMAQTGHRSVLVLRRYIRDGSLFRDNPAASVGL